jgi:cytochrome P450
LNVMLASANRDEDVIDDPDRLDITRADISHLTFGFGPHHCLGAALARMEAQISLRAFTQRFPSMRLATDRIEWRKTHMNRGPQTLPVVLGPERR